MRRARAMRPSRSSSRVISRCAVSVASSLCHARVDVGGAALEATAPLAVDLDPAIIAVGPPERSMPEPAPSEGHEGMVARQLAEAHLPGVFAPYMPEGLRWRFLAPGVKQVELDLKWNGCPARLVRFPPGYVVPLHTHEGPELTVCLQGSFADGEQVMHRGDVEVCDDAHKHQLRVSKDSACICLFVADSAPVPLDTARSLAAAVSWLVEFGRHLRRYVRSREPAYACATALALAACVSLRCRAVCSSHWRHRRATDLHRRRELLHRLARLADRSSPL